MLMLDRIVHISQTGGEFGKGDIRGVIAPESANNADNGGARLDFFRERRGDARCIRAWCGHEGVPHCLTHLAGPS